MHDAENLEKNGDYTGALKGFKDAYTGFEDIQKSDPDWEPALVGHRMDDAKVTILRLQQEIGNDVAKARQTATAGTPFTPSPIAAATPPPSDFVFETSSPRKPKLPYPWKTGIVTTMFYIGEGANRVSAWNQNWAASNHGKDDPAKRNGFASADHASTVNPFYIALPFNDLTYPDKARQWVPPQWQRAPHDGKPVSACQHRWVEIKTEDGTGHVCYAQWEDVGPLRNDHAEYVFGPEKPDTGNRAGLDVSPAVAQYIGMDNMDKSDEPFRTRWRFVDEQDVPPGQWMKLDEQAVIYTALHQSKDVGADSAALVTKTPGSPGSSSAVNVGDALAPDSTKP